MELRLLISVPLLAVSVFGGACGEGSIGDVEDRGNPREAFNPAATGVDAGETNGDSAGDDGPSVGAREFPNTTGRGPTGQWPPGFPAYSTPADIVTDGSSSDLSSALKSGSCSGGCVIEHPGHIPAMTLTREGSGEIVVRPPIGQRADYLIMGKADIRASDLLIAGFGTTSNMLVSSGSNSGFAWIENEDGEGQIAVYGNGGDVARGIFYEVLYRRFSPPGLGDRGGIRAGGGGYADMLVVGSVLTGDPSEPPAHADTLQSYYDSGGGGLITVYDSVVWPSWDKAFQGEGNVLAIVCDNVWIASPSDATKLWPGPGSINFGQPFHTTAAAEYSNSTIIGPGHLDSSIRVWDSELYEFPTAIDMGGNTILTQRVAPPPVPSHEQLDAIWSP